MDSRRHLDTDGGNDLLRTAAPQCESIARRAIEGVPEERPDVVSHLSLIYIEPKPCGRFRTLGEPSIGHKKGVAFRDPLIATVYVATIWICATEEFRLFDARMEKDRPQVRSSTLGDSDSGIRSQSAFVRTQRASIARYWVTRFPV